MRPLKLLTHEKIRRGLQKGRQLAKKIYDELGINENATRQEVFVYIKDDLKSMNFHILPDDKFLNVGKNQSVPAITVFNSKDRKAGGIIKINPMYQVSDILEALFHEYAHIKDLSLPIYSTDPKDLNSEAIYDKSYIELIEFSADMIAYTLLMPPEQLIKDVRHNSYNIDNLLALYYDIEKSSVLQWLTVIDIFPCHFAWILLPVNTNQKMLHDDCYYDHELDPKTFIIHALNTVDSATYIAIDQREKLPDGKINKVTTVAGKQYQCFAYFEGEKTKKLLNNDKVHTAKYDRVLIIGWAEGIYKFIKELKS